MARELIKGNEAIVKGAILAGCRYFENRVSLRGVLPWEGRRSNLAAIPVVAQFIGLFLRPSLPTCRGEVSSPKTPPFLKGDEGGLGAHILKRSNSLH